MPPEAPDHPAAEILRGTGSLKQGEQHRPRQKPAKQQEAPPAPARSGRSHQPGLKGLRFLTGEPAQGLLQLLPNFTGPIRAENH